MLQNDASRYIETVRSDAWRIRFLDKVSLLEEYDSYLINHGVTSSIKRSGVPLTLWNNVADLINSYPERELVAAKQYYNNDHLIHFWRDFVDKLGKMTSSGVISRDFPLFKVSINLELLSFNITGIPIQQFSHSHYYKISDQPLQYASALRAGAVQNYRAQNTAITSNTEFASLKGKLIVLNTHVYNALCKLYYAFLESIRRSKSIVWASYRIHQFLDCFLHIEKNSDSGSAGAPFEAIFANSNIYELTLFLEHHFSEGRHLSLIEVDHFLERQRKYILSQAVSISLEETEALNHCKNLLIYDEQQGVVRLSGLTDEIKMQLREKMLDPYQRARLDGCPFAKSKGSDRNALLEVYEYFDRLALYLLSNTPEFSSLFEINK